ncbi:MAG: nucleotidyltransferase domain-containing protein [Gemmatimonadota bacterium]
MQSAPHMQDLCRRFEILAVYLFGSRADEGLRRLGGERALARGGSDLDVGIVFRSSDFSAGSLSLIQIALEDAFDPLAIDLVPLQRVDPLLAFAAIDGHRVAVADGTAAGSFELDVMRAAAELLPVQRRLERDLFGVSTTRPRARSTSRSSPTVWPIWSAAWPVCA